MKHINLIKTSFVSLAVAVLAITLMAPNTAFAQYTQDNNRKVISIDKKVRSLNEDTFYDNIDKTHKVFHTGEIIEFSVRIENTGAEALTQVSIEDVLPKNLELVFNPGEFNKDSNNIRWKIDTLAPAEVKTYYIRAKISKYSNNLESKMTNWVEAQANGVSDRDTSSYYVGEGAIPASGDPTLILKTFGLISGVAGAFALRRSARGY